MQEELGCHPAPHSSLFPTQHWELATLSSQGHMQFQRHLCSPPCVSGIGSTADKRLNLRGAPVQRERR